MPVMKAAGTNTAHSTSAMAIKRGAHLVHASCAASRGERPAAMLRSTFSTTTMASSTTMPIASTSPNSERLLSEKPNTAMKKNVPIERHRDGDDRDDGGAPGLQEQDDHQHHQDDRLDDGLDDGVRPTAG